MAHLSTCSISLHGNRVSYRCGGDGPLLVLIHGITSSSASWEPVLPELAEHFTILAPDLLGHGQSDKPAGDYSLGSHACLVRDLMLALATSAPRSSGTRSAAASRCRSATSSPISSAGSCSSAAAASGAR
jgi:hypothetical protein